MSTKGSISDYIFFRISQSFEITWSSSRTFGISGPSHTTGVKLGLFSSTVATYLLLKNLGGLFSVLTNTTARVASELAGIPGMTSDSTSVACTYIYIYWEIRYRLLTTSNKCGVIVQKVNFKSFCKEIGPRFSKLSYIWRLHFQNTFCDKTKHALYDNFTNISPLSSVQKGQRLNRLPSIIL